MSKIKTDKLDAETEGLLATARPLGNRALVKRDPKVEKVGSIHLTDNARQPRRLGTVVRVGPGKLVDGVLVPLPVKAGDRVFMSGYAGVEASDHEMSKRDDDYIIVREEEMLAVVD